VETALSMGLFDGMFAPKPIQQEEEPEPPAPVATKKRRNDAKLNRKWISSMFNNPFHGHGSAENELEDMYEAQQKMLEERQQLFGNWEANRKKYKDFTVDHLRDIRTHEHDPAQLNKKEDDAMYVDENDPGFSFPSFPGKKSKFQPWDTERKDSSYPTRS